MLIMTFLDQAKLYVLWEKWSFFETNVDTVVMFEPRQWLIDRFVWVNICKRGLKNNRAK